LKAFASSGHIAIPLGAGFRPHFLGPRNSKQELFNGPDGPDLIHLLAQAFLL
jgi:hypothetical protein